MGQEVLCASIGQLREQFLTLNWTYHDVPVGSQSEKMFCWPGPPDEEILICVHQSGGHQELFHRHDFFYFNFTYQGEYDSIIQRKTFFRTFLPMLSTNTRLFHFLLDPATNEFSDEFIHFKIEHDCNIRILLEMMVIEYANKRDDSQTVLKSLALSFLLQIARQYVQVKQTSSGESLSKRIVQYMNEYFDNVTLKDIAKHFSYHPNYVSTLLHRELGKSFSDILLEQRMERAVILLKGTNLSIEEVAALLGYSNSSNFYKAFREYFKHSPREYIATQR